MLEKSSLRGRVLALKVGERIVVSFSQYGYPTVRTYASELGISNDRKYSTHRNKKEKTISIIRTA